MVKDEKIIPDTSIIIEGIVSKQIEKKELKPKCIVIHEAVIAELEAQIKAIRSRAYFEGSVTIGEILRAISTVRNTEDAELFSNQTEGKPPPAM